MDSRPTIEERIKIARQNAEIAYRKHPLGM